MSAQYDQPFSYDAIVSSHPVYHFFHDNIGIRTTKQRIGLAIYCLVPILITSIITLFEGNFFLGSVSYNLGQGIRLHGMSFLGDTMVWPYFLWLPVCLLLCNLAIRRSTILLNKIVSKASLKWLESDEEYGYFQSFQRTNEIFSYNRKTALRFLKFVPFLVVGIIWIYNTTTCSFNDAQDIGDRGDLPVNVQELIVNRHEAGRTSGFFGRMFSYPYHDNVVNLSFTTNEDLTREEVENQYRSVLTKALSPRLVKLKSVGPDRYEATFALSQQLMMPKWDTNFKRYRVSNIVARFDSLLVYGITPFLLIQFFVLIIGTIHFLRSIIQYENKHEKEISHKPLEIQPFAEDGFGGLAYLAVAGMSFLYVVTAVSVLMIFSFIKENVSASPHDYLLLFLFLPAAIFCFLYPTMKVRKTILRAKQDYLLLVSTKINRIANQILESNETVMVEGQTERMDALILLYEQGMKMPNWPLTYTTMLKFVLTTLSPITILIIQALIEAYFL